MLIDFPASPVWVDFLVGEGLAIHFILGLINLKKPLVPLYGRHPDDSEIILTCRLRSCDESAGIKNTCEDGPGMDATRLGSVEE